MGHQTPAPAQPPGKEQHVKHLFVTKHVPMVVAAQHQTPAPAQPPGREQHVKHLYVPNHVSMVNVQHQTNAAAQHPGQDRHVKHCPSQDINVNNAVYGRLNYDTCKSSSMHTKNCNSSKSKQEVSNRCNGLRTCSVAPSNSIFGDPCRGTHKYLDVDYECRP